MHLQFQTALIRTPAKHAGVRTSVVLILYWLLACWSVSSHAQTLTQTLDRIKTAYVYNFAKFVDFAGAEDKQIRVCIVGKDDLNGAMLNLNRRLAQGREIMVRKDVTLDQAKDCHMIFVGEADVRIWPVLVKQLNHAPVLLVGDGRQAVDQGAHLALIFNEDRVEFDVNLAGLQKANIKASSQMLKLARVVIR